jgi:hypothetical protein
MLVCSGASVMCACVLYAGVLGASVMCACVLYAGVMCASIIVMLLVLL